jgi:hypothetical protein
MPGVANASTAIANPNMRPSRIIERPRRNFRGDQVMSPDAAPATGGFAFRRIREADRDYCQVT